MMRYIKITKYLSGPSLAEQLKEIVDAGQMDAETRVFFAKNNGLNSGDIAYMVKMFEVISDFDFDAENVVFKPREWYLKSIRADKENR